MVWLLGPSHINKHTYQRNKSTSIMLWLLKQTQHKPYIKKKKDKLHAHQCLIPDMVLRHPMSWYRHRQPHLPSSQADMQWNQRRCHCSMLRKKIKGDPLEWLIHYKCGLQRNYSIKFNSGSWTSQDQHNHELCAYCLKFYFLFFVSFAFTLSLFLYLF